MIVTGQEADPDLIDVVKNEKKWNKNLVVPSTETFHLDSGRLISDSEFWKHITQKARFIEFWLLLLDNLISLIVLRY